jgi:hypothetical protein
MKLVIKLIAATLFLVGAVKKVPAQQSAFAWVLNSLGETLTRVDLSEGSVQTNAVTVGSAPNDIVLSDSKAYVVNSLSNNVQLVDLEEGQTAGVIEIYLGLNPYFIALDGETRAFVSNFLTGNISVLDLEGGIESDIIQVGGALEGILIVGDRVFVSDVNYNSGAFGPGRLYALSRISFELLDEIIIGINPQIIRLGPEGMLHVVCTGDFDEISGEVYIVNPATLAVEEIIPIGGSPGSLAFDSQGVAYLGAAGWNGLGAVYTYDGFTYEILRGEANPISVPSAAMGVATTPDDHILVCCFNSDELVELDANGNTVRSFNVGDGPVTVAVQNIPNAAEANGSQSRNASLSYNFPQPFNAQTTLVYRLLRPASVILKLYDTSGRLVRRQSLGGRRAGEHRIVVSPDARWGSGCYFYQISAGDYIFVGKLFYLK